MELIYCFYMQTDLLRNRAVWQRSCHQGHAVANLDPIGRWGIPRNALDEKEVLQQRLQGWDRRVATPDGIGAPSWRVGHILDSCADLIEEECILASMSVILSAHISIVVGAAGVVILDGILCELGVSGARREL